MIKGFRSKGLAELWDRSTTAKVDSKLHKRILARLGVIDSAELLTDFAVPGYDFHALKGFDPTRYTIHVNGPWCITFTFDGRDVDAVDLEQYH